MCQVVPRTGKLPCPKSFLKKKIIDIFICGIFLVTNIEQEMCFEGQLSIIIIQCKQMKTAYLR